MANKTKVNEVAKISNQPEVIVCLQQFCQKSTGYPEQKSGSEVCFLGGNPEAILSFSGKVKKTVLAFMGKRVCV
ncbi:hypothetical protein [Shimia thalassica]|uniref:hypothetical protein n=1 Tax=Shimia thalassica TaxID=1715693 RepID=UPI00071DE2F6|nr:hypothetical protein [Shimia thalassica]